MKRCFRHLILFALLIFCVVLLPRTQAAAAEVASGTCGSNLTWTLDDEGTLTISGTGEMDYSSAPWASYRTSIKTIIVSDSVTSIPGGAFSGCSSLESITLPLIDLSKTTSGSTPYDSDTFRYPFGYIFGTSSGSGLTGVRQPFYRTSYQSTTELSTTFYIPSSLRSVTITSGKIMNNAFCGCSMLTNITISNGVTSIGYEAFSGCIGLTSITIPDGVNSIGSGAFSGCTSLESITLPFIGGSRKTASDTYQYPFGFIFGTNSGSGLTRVKQVYYGSSTSSTSNATYYIPSSLRSVTVTGGEILYGAFYCCSMLGNVTIENGVTSIGEKAFYGCSGLTSITIPDSLITLGADAFSGTAYYDDPSNWDDGLLYICKALIKAQTSIAGGRIIKTDTVIIGNSAFNGCSGLTSITIPDGVTTLGNYAFYGCTGLTSITIPDSATSIGDYAFSGCSGLKSITIPDSVNSIGEKAFSGCTSLTSITIPDGVTSIGEKAFYGCSGLTSITIPDSLITLGADAFSGTAYYDDPSNWDDGLLYICNALIKAQTSIAGGRIIKTDTVIIGNSAFNGCSGLTSITIPDSATSIGDYAFSGCSGLTSITIPDSVTSIDGSAFSSCSGLTNVMINMATIPSCFSRLSSIKEVVLGSNVASIGNDAFYNCSGLTSIAIPDSVTSIGTNAFYGCNSLTYVDISDIGAWCRITFSNTNANPLTYAHNLKLNGTAITSLQIPDSVASIGNYAFRGCSSLTSITIPDGVTSIGIYAFYGCSGLTGITIPDGVTNIGGSAFKGCTRLTSITIPAGVTTLGDDTFYGCTRLTSITIPDGVTTLGNYAFYGCTGLTYLTIPDSVTTLGEGVFSDSSSLRCILLLGNVTGIGKNAFKNIGSNAIMYAPSTSSIPSNASFSGKVYRDRDTFLEAAFEKGYLSREDYSEGTVTILNGSSTMPKWYERGAEVPIRYLPDPGYAFAAAALDGALLTEERFTVPDKESFTLEIVLSKQYDAVAGGTCGERLYWCVTTDNELVFYGNGRMDNYSSTTNAPWYSYRSQIKALRFDGTVRSIGSYAFHSCSALQEVTIPGTVKTIGAAAFKACKQLSRAILSEGVEVICGDTAGTTVFDGCSGLLWQNGGYIVLPSTLSSAGWPLNYLESDVFYIGGGTTDAIAPDSGATTWHRIDSMDDIAVLSVESVDGGTVKLSKLFAAPGDTVKLTFEAEPGYKLELFRLRTATGPIRVGSEYVIPSGGNYLFGAKTIAPTGEVITGKIGSYTTYWIADGEAHICGSGSTNNYAYSSGGYSSYSPLSERSDYTKIVIEDGITGIGTGLFYKAYRVTEVEFADSVTSIGAYAFAELHDLKQAALPKNLTTIQSGAFSNAYAMEYVSIPGSVNSVGQSAFSGTSLHSAGPVGSGCDIEFGWTNSIPANAFAYAGDTSYPHAGLERVVLPEGITTIGANAFRYWDSSELCSVYLPDTLTSIGTNAFDGCTKLKSAGGAADNVRLPVTETFNSGILRAFPYLETVTVPTGTKTIEDSTFSGMTNLKTVVLSAGVETVGENAFNGCTTLTSIALPRSLTSLGSSAFASCAALEAAVLPSGVTEIKKGTFADCAALKRVDIKRGVNSIAMSAFNGCTALADVYYEGTEAEWGAVTVSPLLNDPLVNAVKHFDCASVTFGTARIMQGSGTKTYEFPIRSSAEGPATVCGARYRSDGKFLGVVTLELLPGQEGTLTVTAKNGDIIRVYAVESGSFAPLTAPVNLTA